jgi:hypothetical protein
MTIIPIFLLIFPYFIAIFYLEKHCFPYLEMHKSERNQAWLGKKLDLTSKEISTWLAKKLERNQAWLGMKYQAG